MLYIYDNLKYIREKQKLSLNSFASKLNTNVSNVSRWENNKNGMSLDTANEISKKLNIPLEDLIAKDLRIEENVKLDDTHKLDYLVLEKTKELSDEDKKKIIDIIDIYKK